MPHYVRNISDFSTLLSMPLRYKYILSTHETKGNRPMENLTAIGFVQIGQEQFNELYYQWIIDFKSNPFNFSDDLYNNPTNNTFWVKKDWLTTHNKQCSV